jgi:nucleoside-diphosphate-sugar epimerase
LEEISLNPSQEFYRTNSEGTIRLVQQAIVANVKHFIFISSIGAMTTLSNEIINEKSPCTPDTPYGISKLLAEEALINLASNSKMNWTILRPTLVYGPGNPGNMQRLFKLVDRGLPLPLGSVKNQRSLIYVGNLVDIIINCLENPRAVNESFIVSDGENISTPKLIRSISKAIQRPSRLLPVPVSWLRFIGKITGRSSSIDRLLGSLAVDNFKICHRLNWTPPYTLDQGLQATADWYLDRPSKR